MSDDANQANRLPFARVGADVMIWPLAKIVAPEQISLGDSVIVDDFVWIDGGQRTEIGSFVHLAVRVTIAGGGQFVVEDFGNVSGGTLIYTGSDDFLGSGLLGPTVPVRYRGDVTRSLVRIGRHAIVGAGCVILPGVEIGEGAAVGAHSLVTRSCEPWTVYAGSPARPIRSRPRGQILEMAERLRRDCYDASGRYIPRALQATAPR